MIPFCGQKTLKLKIQTKVVWVKWVFKAVGVCTDTQGTWSSRQAMDVGKQRCKRKKREGTKYTLDMQFSRVNFSGKVYEKASFKCFLLKLCI